MFDTVQVGRKIAELRKQSNMTQFELADKMGISFQAVSNWERGNSMPDISKLPEMAELFNVSIDVIIGKENDILSKVVSGEEPSLGNYSDTEIKDAAMLMKPRQVEKLVDAVDCQPQAINVLLPYLSESYVEDLVDKLYKSGECILGLLPFLSEAKVKYLAFEAFEKGGIQSLAPYLPFMNEADIKTFAEEFLKEDK